MVGAGDSYLLMRGSVFFREMEMSCLPETCEVSQRLPHWGSRTRKTSPDAGPDAKVGSEFLSLEWMGIPSDDLNVKTCPELVSLRGPEGSRFLGTGTLSRSGIVGIHRKVTKMDLQNIYKPTGAIKPHPVSNYDKSKTLHSKNER